MHIKLPEILTAETVEGWLRDAGRAQPTSLELDASRWRGCRLFAEARLLGFLSIFVLHRFNITLHVGAALSPTGARETRRRWDLFAGSLGGLVVGQLAARVLSRGDHDQTKLLREEQAKRLAQGGGLVQVEREIHAPILDRFARPAAHDLMVRPDIRQFVGGVRVLLDRIAVPRVAAIDLAHVARFAFEVVQNTRQHGAEDLYDRSVEGLRVLTLKRLPLRGAEVGSAKDPVAVYLRGLSAASRKWPAPPNAAIELTVADCGVGIPARMAGRMDIYDGDIRAERQQLEGALLLRGTSKAGTIVGAGQGLFSALRATRALRGLILVRVGRLQMHKDYLSNGEDSTGELGDWTAEGRPRVMGTSVSLILPIFESAQRDLAY